MVKLLDKMSVNYEIGSIVWVRLGQKWWPGRVTSLEECPSQYTSDLKKDPLAIVRFFNESGFHDVTKPEHIFPYSCSRKQDFIRRVLNAVKSDSALREKFEADVAMAEKLTGGNMKIVKELKEINKRRIDYSDLGFGTPKPKKHSKDQSMQREGFSDIGEAIQYKRGSSPLRTRIIEHKVKIMEQPKQKGIEEEIRNVPNWFKCYVCGFTCGRLNVIIWHNKVHLKKVEDYDSGIRIPGRRKRKQKKPKSRDKKKNPKPAKVDHSQTNGHVSPKHSSQETSQLLLDWEDDEPEENETKEETSEGTEEATINGVENEEEMSDDYEDDSNDEYDDNYPPPSKGHRQPMPKQIDINSAFDALLAESSPLNRSNNSNYNNNSPYVNNDTDSECSDWEKYYAKESDSENSTNNKQESDIRTVCEKENQNGHCLHTNKSNSVKKFKQTPSSSSLFSPANKVNSTQSVSSIHSSSKSEETETSESSVRKANAASKAVLKKERTHSSSHLTPLRNRSSSPQPLSAPRGSTEGAVSPSSPGPSISKSSSPLPDRSREEPSEEHSTHSSSSSSSTSSGPAYMLVAVDAHGNNVPMPVLNEGGNHLVAVEASMEDGTTRTLYIDPAHLGPNVDLNNLMLHIDNSGQETVIIPTSSSDGEIISSTLVEQSSHELSSQSVEDGTFQSSRTVEEVIERQRGDQHLGLETKVIVPSVPALSLSSPREEEFPHREKEDAADTLTSATSKFQNVLEIDISTLRNSQNGHLKKPEEKSDKRRCLKEERREKEARARKEERKKKNKKKKKKDKRKKENERKMKIETLDDDDDDDLPDLEMSVSKQHMFSPNEVVWVLTHGLWWPSFVLKIYGKENKASILFINCQQKTPIKVSLNRMKTFCYLDYTDIFESQKNKAAGLTEAMEMASHYRSLKEANGIKETPREFFKLPLIEQRSIINRQTLTMRGVPVDVEISGTLPLIETNTENSIEEELKLLTCGVLSPEVSEDCLSERDKIKLASAIKARRTSNERFVRFIQSNPCLDHLRQICDGRISSQRHQYFKGNYRDQNFLLEILSTHNTGIDFFGQEDTEQTEDVLSFLFGKFEKDLASDLDSSQRKMYVNTVLFPEAIKESLRVLTKLPEEELETALENGLSETRTEKKAKRLEYTR